MLHSHTHCFHHHHLLFPNPLILHHKPSLPLLPSHTFLHKPSNTLHSVSVSAIPPLSSSELTPAAVEEGPIELPFSSTTDDPSPIQFASSILLTGAVSVFLFRSLRRRANRSKELVRQITITIRTIINGLTYLATFVFGLNSLGLFLYSGQLAINSFMEGSTEKETESKSTDQSRLPNSSVESPMSNTELSSRKEEQSSKDAQ